MKKNAVGMQLRRLNNQIMRYIENSPVKKRVETITGTNGWIISYLADHADQDIYQKDLEKRFGITRSTASKAMTSMEQKGLIARESVPQDARLKKIVLTRKAVEINEMIHKDVARLEQDLTRGFTQKEIESLLGFLERMQNNLKRK
jgi:DNA-binding MarR family transcriptional regulator